MNAVAAPNAAPRRPDGPWFAIVALPVVAFVVPAGVVVAGPLASNGWPARMLVFWIAAAVALGWFVGRGRSTRTSPAQVGTWLLVVALIGATAAAYLRHLTPPEAAGVLRAALVMFPLTILALGVAATADRRRCDVLLVSIVVGASFSAVIAAAQFISYFDLAQAMDVPGLEVRAGGAGIRADFQRVTGSAGHPIELAVISGSIFPLALHFARFGATQLRRHAAAFATVLLLVANPASVSRSGVAALAVAALVYALVLTNRQRLTLLVLSVAGATLFRAVVPGLLGALRSLFVGAAKDDSVTGRTDDYVVINDFFHEAPFLGRGLGTFRPEDYFFVDNQYLLAVVEGGALLLAATVLWFLLAMASARGAARRARREEDRSRAQAVLAAITAIGVSGTLFDLFSFEQATVVVFLLCGVAGALWRDGMEDGLSLPSVAERLDPRQRPRGPGRRSRGVPGNSPVHVPLAVPKGPPSRT
ncbi:O-antigen ligase family protein [Georgenia yuyongxinii]|nr:O-antigen ligase family protein [Georgenia yuyongxinii]